MPFYVGQMKRNTERIIELIKQGLTASEIMEDVGCTRANVHNTAKRYGLIVAPCMRVFYTEQLKADMRNYKQQGHTNKEVARYFGVSENKTKKICRGIAPQVINQYTCGTFDREAHAKIKIAEYLKGKNIEYIGGFTHCDGTVQLRCTVCGNVFTRAMTTIRKYQCACDVCKDREQTEKTIAKEQAKAQKEQERKKAKQQKAIELAKAKELAKKAKEHECAVCGAKTMRPKYCSDKCLHKAMNKSHEVARRTKIRNAMVDKDITLEALYKRDGGACHICGLQCNYNDYVVRGGTVITGEYYPSIDHVIPLAKGGKHSWINVRLAHRRCNSCKSDKIAL